MYNNLQIKFPSIFQINFHFLFIHLTLYYKSYLHTLNIYYKKLIKSTKFKKLVTMESINNHIGGGDGSGSDVGSGVIGIVPS